MTVRTHRIIQWLAIALILLAGAGWYYRTQVKGAMQVTTPNKDGLVGYWSFDEGSGTQAGDASGSGNTGTLTNGPTWTNGARGKALQFDGVDDYVEIASLNNVNFPTLGTLAFWINPSAGFQKSVFSSYGGANRHIFIRTNDTISCSSLFGGIQISFQNPDTSYVFNKNACTPLNTWTNIVVAWDTVNDLGYVYTNGVLTGSGAITDSSWVPDQQTVRLSSVGGNQYTGSLDEVRVYNRALSASEITTLYQSGAVKVDASQNNNLTNGLVGLWSFDGPDVSGTTVYDRSGQGNNGVTGFDGTFDRFTKVIGKIGQAINFTGQSLSGVNIPSIPASSNMAQFTYCTWVKPTTLTNDAGASYIMIATKANLSNISFDTSTGIVTFNVATTSTYPAVSSSSALVVGKWQHVCGVYSGIGNAPSLYIDGAQNQSSSTAGSGSRVDDSAALFRLSANNGGYTNNFNGAMDEVRVYNRALSASEITELYQAGEAKVNASQNNDLTSGLVGQWSFDGPDVSGTTAYDRSGSGNNGTLTNGPTKTIGKVGQALQFDGVDDYVNLGIDKLNTVLEGKPAVTLSAWVKPATVTSQMRAIGFVNGNLTGALCGFQSGVVWAGGRSIPGEGFQSTTTTAPAAGQWSHILCVIDYTGDRISIYINGVLAASPAAAFTSNTLLKSTNASTSDSIGNYGDPNSDQFNGTIDEVRIYNRALSASEVSSLYNMGR